MLLIAMLIVWLFSLSLGHPWWLGGSGVMIAAWEWLVRHSTPVASASAVVFFLLLEVLPGIAVFALIWWLTPLLR